MFNPSRFSAAFGRSLLKTIPGVDSEQDFRLDDFIRLFKTHKSPTLELAMSWMKRLYLSPEFVKSYTAFNKEPYSYEIVHQDGRCEALILSWGEGQRSYVHNHDGELAVLRIYSGKLLSRRWTVVKTPTGKELGEFLGEEILEPGAIEGIPIAQAHELIALEDSISIHCYTRPLSFVCVFDPISSKGELKPVKQKLV